MAKDSSQISSSRIESIDVLRGLALALMLLVNNPGSWGAVYAPFLHADWHGMTPTDLVFPFFLFVVGASMACSLREHIQKDGLPWMSVLKRSALLFFIGLLLHIIPFDQSPENWRILGVLQRIALCFFLVAVLVALVRERWLVMIAIAMLLVYWLVMVSFGNPPYSLEGNVARQIDLAVLGESHMWNGKGLAFDPEGLFSTIGSVVTVLSGYLVCTHVLQGKSYRQQIQWLLVIAACLLPLGLVWSIWHPINKYIWTGSYVLVTTALACLSLAIFILLGQVFKIKHGLHALKVYGSNPIFIYVAAWLFAVLLSRVSFNIGEQNLSVKAAIYQFFAQFMPDKLASLSFAVFIYRSVLSIGLVAV